MQSKMDHEAALDCPKSPFEELFSIRILNVCRLLYLRIICAKFHNPQMKFRATFVEKTRTEVIPLPSYTEKGKAFASLGP